MKPSDMLKSKKEEVIKIAKSYEDNGIFNIRIFGSVARGEDNEESDIDFAATVGKGKTGKETPPRAWGRHSDIIEFFGLSTT